MVMDCGTSTLQQPETVGERLIVPYMQSHGIDNIDVAVLGHPHSDHVSGFAGLIEAKPAKMVLDLGVSWPSPYYKKFLQAVKNSGASYGIARRGQIMDMGDGVVATVLNPDPARRYSDLNNNSIAIRITYGKTAILLAANDGFDAEGSMLSSNMELRSQVLQVGHHGSAYATSPEWLAAVRPRIAIISCGLHNEYHHPSPRTIKRLTAFGATVYRTDKNGAVTVTTDGTTITAQPFRDSQ